MKDGGVEDILEKSENARDSKDPRGENSKDDDTMLDDSTSQGPIKPGATWVDTRWMGRVKHPMGRRCLSQARHTCAREVLQRSFLAVLPSKHVPR